MYLGIQIFPGSQSGMTCPDIWMFPFAKAEVYLADQVRINSP